MVLVVWCDLNFFYHVFGVDMVDCNGGCHIKCICIVILVFTYLQSSLL